MKGKTGAAADRGINFKYPTPGGGGKNWRGEMKGEQKKGSKKGKSEEKGGKKGKREEKRCQNREKGKGEEKRGYKSLPTRPFRLGKIMILSQEVGKKVKIGI